MRTRARLHLACLLAGISPVAFAAGPAADSAHPAASTGIQAPKQAEQGDMGTVTAVGKNLQKLQVGKFDPPAAFNLEDIQNFPEDRLQPVLNNPLTFDEGRDFSSLMDFQDEQLYH